MYRDPILTLQELANDQALVYALLPRRQKISRISFARKVPTPTDRPTLDPNLDPSSNPTTLSSLTPARCSLWPQLRP